jgi:hypothetical protein
MRIAKNRITVVRIATDRSMDLNLRATGLTGLRHPERGTWQSAVHLRAVCQEVIPVAAIRGI